MVNTGVVIWMLGDPEKAAEVAAIAKNALRGVFPFTDIITEKEVYENLCTNEQEEVDLRALAAERLGWLCHLLERNGGAGIALSWTSRRSERDMLRKKCTAMIEILIEGDYPEGFEPPFYPEVEVRRSDTPTEIKSKLLNALQAVGIACDLSGKYSKEDEAIVRERLEKLGYL